MPSPDILRVLLILYPLGMACLAAFYLHSRSLPLAAYIAWGSLILLLPILGPFLVLLAAPGRPRR